MVIAHGSTWLPKTFDAEIWIMASYKDAEPSIVWTTGAVRSTRQQRQRAAADRQAGDSTSARRWALFDGKETNVSFCFRCAMADEDGLFVCLQGAKTI